MWAVLADPTRRAVLDQLRTAPRDVGELGRALRLSQPATSKHLRVLREAGLVRVTPQAQRRVYAVQAAPLAELDAWLTPYRELWSASLDALGRHLDAHPDPTKPKPKPKPKAAKPKPKPTNGKEKP